MPLSTRVIRLPVKLVNGHWELLYGGHIRAKEGTIAEMHVRHSAIEDKKFLLALTRKRRILALNEGTELRVALTIKPGLPDPLRSLLLPLGDTKHDHTTRLSVDSHFVAITLGGPTPVQAKREQVGGLHLVLEGMEPRALESGLVALPKSISESHVESLNHAFTRLSEKLEPWRQAHTGSVYERVFYEEPDGLWYPLGDLRDRELAKAERRLVGELWGNVMAEYGTIVDRIG